MALLHPGNPLNSYLIGTEGKGIPFPFASDKHLIPSDSEGFTKKLYPLVSIDSAY